MFRIVITKVPSTVFKPRSHDASGLSKRFYSKTKKYDLCPPPTPQPGNSGAIYTVGAVAVIVGGTMAYAKYDPDFRVWLSENVPYSDDFIKFVLQEDKSYLESIKDFLDEFKYRLTSLVAGSRKDKLVAVEPKNYSPPPPAFNSLAREKEKDDGYSEIRLEQKQTEGEPNVTIGGEIKPPGPLPDEHPKNILLLEQSINRSASAAVQSYNAAVYALKNYNQDVQVIIEDSPERLDPDVWSSLREKTKEMDSKIKDAEGNLNDAKKNMSKLEVLMKETSSSIPDTVRQQTELNIKRITQDLDRAKREFEREQKKASITQKYWKKVEEARGHFIDEIEILFPNVNINEKKLELRGPELDLFILHAFSRVLYYQKELIKLQTMGDRKVKSALEAARKDGANVLTDAQIDALVEKEKLALAEEFQKKCLCLRIDSERELRRQLKIQSEAFSDHLNDAIKLKEQELERRFAREIDEKVTEERCKYKLQLSALAGRVRGMDQAMKIRVEGDNIAKQSQVLWSACQSLYRALRAGCPGLPWTEQLRPLQPEITAVKEASAPTDELVKVVLNGIPATAIERGVFPEDALRERFLKVERVCRQLSLVPEGGARLPLHILSFVQSMLLLNAASPIPQAELNDERTDFTKFSTNDILQRARYWLDRGDFAQTLKYMNLLEGAPRCVASEWMQETRFLLETQQAANTLMAHAAANGLLYL